MAAQQRNTLNFLVPAQGGTSVISMALPGDGNFGTNNYGIDFRSLNLVLLGTLFIPQACTIDCSQLVAGTSVTFNIPDISFNAVIYAGETRTLQFPALQDLRLTITPSSGAPSIPTFWYNYPALPDSPGNKVISSSITTMPPLVIRTATGTDYSSAPPALLANLLLTVPVNSNRNGYVVQNQSANPIQVVFDDGTGLNQTIILLNSGGANAQGSSVNAAGMPHSGRIRVYAANAGQQVAAHDW